MMKAGGSFNDRHHRLRLVATIVTLIVSAVALTRHPKLMADALPKLAAVEKADARTYPARVERVLDGDTVRIQVDLGFNVTLHGVDVRMLDVFAPEKFMPHGAEATAMLSTLLPVGTEITFVPELDGTGKMQRSFTRYVGTLMKKGENINATMRAGLKKFQPGD